MNAKDAKRILDLSSQWQESRRWLSAYHHAEQCREQESKAFAVANVYPVESKRHFEQAKLAREVVDARHAELCELENLLRHHAPKLFGLIPVEINFWDSPPADLSPWLNAMRRIESEFLVLVDEFLEANPAEPAPTAATIETQSETKTPKQPKPDGPIGTSGFRWQKKEKTGLRPDSFQLVSHLWKAIDRTSTWDDLAEPVFDEHEGDYVTSNRLGSVRRDANQFFQTHGFPFKVKLSVKLRKAELEQMPE